MRGKGSTVARLPSLRPPPTPPTLTPASRSPALASSLASSFAYGTDLVRVALDALEPVGVEHLGVVHQRRCHGCCLSLCCRKNSCSRSAPPHCPQRPNRRQQRCNPPVFYAEKSATLGRTRFSPCSSLLLLTFLPYSPAPLSRLRIRPCSLPPRPRPSPTWRRCHLRSRSSSPISFRDFAEIRPVRSTFSFPHC